MFKKENLRKNFLRVKQIADQNLGRVEKTEVLSDDLQASEKRVDLVKHVCSNTVKKIHPSLLSATGTTSDVEKRLKKMPEAGVGHSMIESASMMGPECIMGQMFQKCGECQSSLALKHLQYELDVEKMVIEPMQEILEMEIPQIGKLKKALNKVTLDMDSAKSRWNNAVRQTQTPGANMVAASNKADIVKDELSDAEARVDQAKDAYTTGMLKFISKETDHCQNLLNLLEAQATYHRHALDIIETMIPKMQEVLSCNPTKPVYGVQLEEHLRVTNRDIAQVLEACVCYLIDTGLDEEGLFRIAGMASKVKKLKASFDAGVEFEDNGELDPHTVAGAMKQYLRELPEPLLTFQLYQDFMAAAQQPQDKRLQALWCVVDRLPKPNYDNFRYLIKFLAKLTEKSDVNKMTPSNIAIVIGPNLIWSEGDSGPNMMNTGILSLITELIVQHADWFFPGDVDFHSTQRGSAPEHRMSETAHYSQTSVTKENSSLTTEARPRPLQMETMQGPSNSTVTGQACGVAFTTALGAISSCHVASPEASTSSSESTSLSDITPQMKDYENADTLERRDSTDRYLTAKEINFGYGSSTGNGSPVMSKSPSVHDNHSLERTSSNQSGSSQGTPQTSPANQEMGSPFAQPQTTSTVSRSPSISPIGSSASLHGAPLAESEDFQPVVRRPVRKPAPPPPQDRPYSVAVSASVIPGQQSSQYQTWPRQAITPQGDSPSNTLSQSEKLKMLPPDRPHPPERISSLPHGQHHPDRPKVPPPVVPPGHQRSASTGAQVTIPGGLLQPTETEPGSLYAGAHISPGAHSSYNNQLTPQQEKLSYNSLNRQSSARPPRPMPPPPPPPESTIVEETHL